MSIEPANYMSIKTNKIWFLTGVIVFFAAISLIFSRKARENVIEAENQYASYVTNTPRAHSQMIDARQRELSRISLELKDKWKFLFQNRTDFSLLDEEKELIRECIDRLGISAELIMLMYALADAQDDAHPQTPRVSYLIRQEINELLRAGDASLRGQLLELLRRRNLNQLVPSGGFLAEWIASAGAGIELKDLESFLSEVEISSLDESMQEDVSIGFQYKQDGMLGFCSEHVKHNPEAAMLMIKDQLLKGINSTYMQPSLAEAVSNLPENAVFMSLQLSIIQGITEQIDPESGLGILESLFLRKWSEKSPADAANFVIDNSNVLGYDYLDEIVEGVCINSPISGYEWAQHFPEGQPRDIASHRVVPYLANYPDKAMELASQISNPKLKEEAIEMAKNHMERQQFRK